MKLAVESTTTSMAAPSSGAVVVDDESVLSLALDGLKGCAEEVASYFELKSVLPCWARPSKAQREHEDGMAALAASIGRLKEEVERVREQREAGERDAVDFEQQLKHKQVKELRAAQKKLRISQVRLEDVLRKEIELTTEVAAMEKAIYMGAWPEKKDNKEAEQALAAHRAVRGAVEEQMKKNQEALAAKRAQAEAEAEEQRQKEAAERARVEVERARVVAEERAAQLLRELEAEEAAQEARQKQKQERRRKEKERQRQQRQQEDEERQRQQEEEERQRQQEERQRQHEEEERAKARAAEEEAKRRLREEERRQREEAERRARAEAQQQQQQQQPQAGATKGPAAVAAVAAAGTGEMMAQQAIGTPIMEPIRKEVVVEQAPLNAAAGVVVVEEDGAGGGGVDLSDYLSCPISLALMTDPVVAEDGNTYQRQAIQNWIDRCRSGGRAVTSPMSGLPMGPQLKDNHLVRCLALESQRKA